MRRGDRPPGRRSRLAGLAVAAALALLAAGCTAAGPATPTGKTTETASAAARTAAAAPGTRITITPANGAAAADPSAGITVTAAGGTLTGVTVRTPAGTVPGRLSQNGRTWHTLWALAVSQTYKVTATATGKDAKAVTATSAFRTLSPARTFSTEILEGYDQTYGVGMPIILYFSQPITDKAAVERALQVSTSVPVVGAWYWDEPCNMAVTCAYFRPRDYWPAGTR